MNPPPPIPLLKALSKPMQRFVVMAASTAVPFLSRRMDRPRLEQVTSSEATAAVVALMR
jgi:hypothetical protein